MFQSVIIGSGSYIPPFVQSNADFAKQVFYDEHKKLLAVPSEEVVKKFKHITGIEERRYTTNDLNASDLGYEAAKNAIADSGIDPETLDQVIVAHNFGNVTATTVQGLTVPSLASLIKNALKIENPGCVAYDILFGCPGWLQGLIQADINFKAGVAKRILVIGTETLSRVLDKYDRDSMIFSDGAGAVVLEYKEGNAAGILSFAMQTHALHEAEYINMDSSNNPGNDQQIKYIKMQGRKVYEYAITHVPAAMKICFDKSGVDIRQLKKIFIHQANEKMDEAIIKRFYQLYGIDTMPENIMPMSIGWLGNSSVATIPTLYDMVKKKQLPEHTLAEGDIILFASVGAGMNINAVCYRC